MDLARQHELIFGEVFTGRGGLREQFTRLEKGTKPAVLDLVAHDLDEPDFPSGDAFLRAVDAFVKGATRLGYFIAWVQTDFSPPGGYLVVSKSRTVAKTLASLINPAQGMDWQEGTAAIGLLLGYPPSKVMAFARRQSPQDFRKPKGSKRRRAFKRKK